MRFAIAAALAASAMAVPASAAVITFEEGTAGTAISGYDGITFTNGVFAQCGGGCPAPELGLFATTGTSASPMTATFAALQSSVSFINVSFSSVLAKAYNANGDLLASLTSTEAFPISGNVLTLSGTGIKYVTFEGGFGIDNLSYTIGAVPEPATWAMMISGFGMIGGAMRRRRVAGVSFA